jgi:hypothetical protein
VVRKGEIGMEFHAVSKNLTPRSEAKTIAHLRRTRRKRRGRMAFRRQTSANAASRSFRGVLHLVSQACCCCEPASTHSGPCLRVAMSPRIVTPHWYSNWMVFGDAVSVRIAATRIGSLQPLKLPSWWAPKDAGACVLQFQQPCVAPR